MKRIINIIFFMITIFFIVFCFNYKKTISYETESKVYLQNNKETPTKEDAIKALRTMAKAYYNRGENIQYLSESLTYIKQPDGTTGRSYHQIPENATNQNILSLDCSSFAYLLYEKTFSKKNSTEGYKLGNLEAVMGRVTYLTAIARSDSDYYVPEIGIYTVYNPSVKKDDVISALTDEKSAYKLQPGDLISYTTGKCKDGGKIIQEGSNKKCGEDGNFIPDGSGHVMIYLGEENDEYNIINVSQAVNGYQALRYNFATKKITYNPKGAVGYVNLQNNVLTTKGEINKYIFGKTIYRLSILRPFNEITKENSKYAISDDVLTRMDYPDLVINKTASVNKYDSINLGDTITYTITLENKSDETYENIEVSDEIPKNTEYVESTNLNLNGPDNKLSKKKINLEKNKKIELSYTVRVKNDLKVLGTYIVSDQTKVNNITINSIETYVNPTLTEDEQNQLRKIALGMDGLKTEDNIANIIYQQFGIDVFNNKDTDSIFEEVFNIQIIEEKDIKRKDKYGEGDKNAYTIIENIENNTYGKMYVKNLFGGLFAIDPNKDLDNEDKREVRFSENTLTIGDVLLLYDDDYKKDKYVAGEKNMYLYIGKNEFVTVKDGKVVILNETITDTLKTYGGNEDPKTKRSRLLVSLLAQNAYIVLRPSYSIEIKKAITEPIFNSDELVIDKENKLLKNISIGKKIKNLFKNTGSNNDLEIYSKDNTLLYSTSKTNNKNLATGQYLTFKKINGLKAKYKISVAGDIDGDGKIKPKDYVMVKNHIMKASMITGDEYKSAADFDNNDSIAPLDYVKIKNHIMDN